MKKWQQKLLCGLAVTIGCVVTGYATRDFWREQFKIYVWGSIEVASDNYGWHLPKTIDSVEVFTLSSKVDAANTNGFYGDYPEPYATLSHATLTGTNAARVIELWRSQMLGRNFQAMCFEPAYGLQFKQNGKIYFQTAVCWHCSGYTLPIYMFGIKRIEENGFDSKSKSGQQLLLTLESFLPLPPAPDTH
jgi:hypothetical protein